MTTKVQNENLPTDDVDNTEDEAVSLFAQIANEDSTDSDDADFDNNSLDQDEEEPRETQQSATAKTTQDADPWQSVPPALREQFNQLQHANQQLQQQYGAVTGRLAPTQRELEALKKQLAEQEQKKVNGKDSGPTADEIAGMTDDELEQEWPDIAAALKRREAVLMRKIDEQLAPLNEMRQRTQEQEREREAQAATHQELNKLAQVHPDFKEVARSNEFRNWLNSQPQAIRQIERSMSADDNIALLNLYKNATGAKGKSQQRTGKTALRDQAEIPRRGAGRAAVDPNNADPVALFTQIAT